MRSTKVHQSVTILLQSTWQLPLTANEQQLHRQEVRLTKPASDNGKIPDHENLQAKSLMPYVGDLREEMPDGIPVNLTDYLELANWTGRQIREGKRGAIPERVPPILNRLNTGLSMASELKKQIRSRPFLE